MSVQGQVVNGTAAGPVPAGRTIRVIGLIGDTVEGSWESVVQDDGSYTVADVTRLPGTTYAVGIEYGNAAYVDRVELAPGADVATKDLTVYESVSVDPGIRFEQSAIVLASANPERGTIEATEVHSVNNPTDVTFVPSSQGPGGPAGLLVFALPQGAVELTALMGLNSTQMVQIDRGFASLTPIYPGRTDLSFRYRFPYTDAAVRLERTIRYPVDSYRVLSSEPQVTLQSPQLAESTTADISGRSFQAIAGGPFDRGVPITIVASGLPVRNNPLGSIPLWAITAIGAVIGIGTVVFALGRTRAPVPVLASQDEEEVIDQLLVLERERAEGRIDEESYGESRQALVARAIASRATVHAQHGNGGPE